MVSIIQFHHSCVKLITNDLQLSVLNGTVILRMKIA